MERSGPFLFLLRRTAGVSRLVRHVIADLVTHQPAYAGRSPINRHSIQIGADSTESLDRPIPAEYN
ncbi:MAG TPA: hypothetical protein DDY78_17620 [Planctomycetales bacterium]|nr:hypothetical protein [Planctomycetales bacterium]